MTANRQPWVHDRAVIVHGNGTALSALDGQMRDGADGWFVDDARLLARLVVSLRLPDGTEDALSPVGHAAVGGEAEFLCAARLFGDGIPDPTVEVLRRRTLSRMTLTETVTVASRAVTPVRGILQIDLAGDGAGIVEVKSARAGDVVLPVTADCNGIRWDAPRHRVTVSVTADATDGGVPGSGVPGSGMTNVAVRRGGITDAAGGEGCLRRLVTQSGAARVELDVDLRQGESTRIVLTLTARRLVSSPFDADPACDRFDVDALVGAERDPRLVRLLRTSGADLRGLLLSDPEDPSDHFVAAGTPWYLTLFGRDSLWSARMLLPVEGIGLDLARGTLRALARRQGTTVDATTASAPGKIPHELRRRPVVNPNTHIALPVVYYGTIDATPLWVCLLHDAWRQGLDRPCVEDLLPSLQAAVTWLLEYSCPTDDGLLQYIDRSGSGLANQGWKDSADSMRTATGAVAEAPIALVEAQAYAVEAARSAASLFDEFGVKGGSRLRGWADALVTRVRERFWVDGPDGRYLAMAIDGAGRQVDGVGSNMGHCLGSGLLTPEEEASVVATLMRPDMLGPYGIATLSSTNPGYNPLGYHTGSVWTHDTAICARGMMRAGFPGEARTVAARLLDAAEHFDHRWPELYAGDAVLGRPAPYPASCRPQGWSAASAAVVAAALGAAPSP